MNTQQIKSGALSWVGPISLLKDLVIVIAAIGIFYKVGVWVGTSEERNINQDAAIRLALQAVDKVASADKEASKDNRTNINATVTTQVKILQQLARHEEGFKKIEPLEKALAEINNHVAVIAEFVRETKARGGR